MDPRVDDESEDNDTRQTASFIAENVSMDAMYIAEDDDWYELEVCPNGTLEVIAQFVHADGDLELKLTDEFGVVYTSSLNESDQELLDYTHLESDPIRLFLHVYSFQGYSNPYALTITLTGCE